MSFSYTDDNNNLAYGFIAEDIKDIPILSNTITLAKNGQISGINYQEIFVITTAYLINSQKELNQIIFEFKKKIATQDNNLIEIIERIQKIEENIKLLTQSIEKFTAQ